MVIALVLLREDVISAALERRVDILEAWLTFWTSLVVLGLLYEYGYSLFGFNKSRAFRWVVRLSHLGAILVTVGVAGELYVEVVASDAQWSLRTFSNDRVSKAENTVATAQRDAETAKTTAKGFESQIAAANARAAEANLRTEEERHARVRLERSFAWRHVSRKQQDSIRRAVAALHLSAESLSVSFTDAADPEAIQFAVELVAGLRLPNGPSIGPFPRYWFPPRFGLWIDTFNPYDSLADSLRSILESNGIPVTGIRSQIGDYLSRSQAEQVTAGRHSLELFVGFRPLPQPNP